MIGQVFAPFARWWANNEFFERRERDFLQLAQDLRRDTSRRLELIPDTYEAWAERESSRGNSVGGVYAAIATEMKEGRTYSEALAELIPVEEALVIYAGEVRGNLSDALTRAVRIKNVSAEMAKAVSAAMWQPAQQFFQTLLVSLMLGMMAWPQLIQAIPIQFWPTWSLPAIYIDLWLAKNWPSIGLLLVVYFCYQISLPRWVGPTRAFLDRFPPYSTYREHQASVMMMALAGFIANNFLLPEALRRISERVTPYLRWHIHSIIPEIERRGDDALEAFNTGLLSRDVMDRLDDSRRNMDLGDSIMALGDSSLDALVNIVRRRAAIVSLLCSAVAAVLFMYSTAVQVLATKAATDAYMNAVKTGMKIH